MDAIWRSIMATVKEQPLILQASQALRPLQMQPPAGTPPSLAWLLPVHANAMVPSMPSLLCLSIPPHCACQVLKRPATCIHVDLLHPHV